MSYSQTSSAFYLAERTRGRAFAARQLVKMVCRCLQFSVENVRPTGADHRPTDARRQACQMNCGDSMEPMFVGSETMCEFVGGDDRGNQSGDL